MKEKNYEKGGEYLDSFIPYWSEYQDTWDAEMWNEYEYYRGVPPNNDANKFGVETQNTEDEIERANGNQSK